MRNILLVSVNGFTFKACLLITCLWMSFFAQAKDSTSIETARAWLKLVDSGEYLQSWQQTDYIFQTATPEPKWRLALEQLRIPLGRVMSRTYFDVQEYSSLPGMPNGEYLVVQFQTSFTNKEHALETLSLSKNSGQWQPLGYLIN